MDSTNRSRTFSLLLVLMGLALGGAIPPLGANAVRELADIPKFRHTSANAQAQNVPGDAGQSAVSGIVRDSVTGAPVSGAVVYLGPAGHGPPGIPARQVTDGKGRFVFGSLPAFDGYFLQASKAGYFQGGLGGEGGGPLSRRFSLASGQWLPDAQISLVRHSALNGRVTNHLGDPLVGVYVRSLIRTPIGGRPRLVGGPIATTDDRGRYRISGLKAAEYLLFVPSVISTLPLLGNTDTANRDSTLSLIPAGAMGIAPSQYPPVLPLSNGRLTAYPPVFYPGEHSADSARAIDLRAGEDKTDIDLRLQPVRTFRVSGKIQAPSEAIRGLTLRLVLPGAEHIGMGGEVGTSLTAEDGSFAFHGVPAGSYTLVAQRSLTTITMEQEALGQREVRLPFPPGARLAGTADGVITSAPLNLNYSAITFNGSDAWYVRLAIDIRDSDLENLIVPLQQSSHISGTFVWDTENPPVSAAARYPRVARAMSAGTNQLLEVFANPPVAEPSATFTISGVIPGQYLLSFGAGPRVKSIAWRGRDYTHTPLDVEAGRIEDVLVTLTAQQTLISGIVRDSRSGTVKDGAVIAFPVRQDLWTGYGFDTPLLSSALVNEDGRYRLNTLPAGEYYVVAVDSRFRDSWRAAAFLAKIAHTAVRLKLDWGETRTQDLTAGR